MSTKLEYLAFLVALVTFLEQRVNHLSWSLYSGVRKRLPTLCASPVDKVEDLVTKAYSTGRRWICEKGEATLVVVDTKVGDAVEWAESRVPTCTCGGRFTAVRNFWTSIAARVSETWKNHGIIVGTVVVLVALFYTFLGLLSKIFHSPTVLSVVEAVQKSVPVKIARSYYTANIHPLVMQLITAVTEAFHKSCAALSGPMDSVRESLSTAIDTLVGTVYYAKFFEGMTAAMTKLSSTDLYSKLAEKAEPYVGPSWERFSHSNLYLNLVDKFTPIKKE